MTVLCAVALSFQACAVGLHMLYHAAREARLSLDGGTMLVRVFRSRFTSVCHADIFADTDLQLGQSNNSIVVIVLMEIVTTQYGTLPSGQIAGPIADSKRRPMWWTTINSAWVGLVDC
jgi:hypothetical protein